MGLMEWLAPLAQNPATPSIKLVQWTDFQKSLADAAKTENPRSALKKLADNYVADKTLFIPSADLLPLQKCLLRFSSLLDKASSTGSLNLKNVTDASNQEFGGSPHDVVNSDEFKTLLTQLKDSVVAIKFAQVCSDHHSIIKPRSLFLVGCPLLRLTFNC